MYRFLGQQFATFTAKICQYSGRYRGALIVFEQWFTLLRNNQDLPGNYVVNYLLEVAK
ncbi:MAG: hypothetical protein KGQ50_04310 [Bacteroidetes bacterium]|nr:hypothetical protein [Bacteroidota bacterium]